MKIDRTRLRKGTSEIPMECDGLIEQLCQCSRSALLEELSKISIWTFRKSELYHWIGVLDVFDSILEEASQSAPALKWALHCDTCYDASERKLLLWTLHFTTVLIEHSRSCHLYNSMEHLLKLMSSSDMNVVLAVLNLLYMFSKHSNFITRLANEKRQTLLSRLHYLAESWGGKENGFGLDDCCIPYRPIPHSATTLHFEFYKENKELKDVKLKRRSSYIHIENVDKLNKTPAEIMKELVHLYFIPLDKEMWLFTHVRLAHHFAEYTTRLLCVQARLQALSVLVYSNALQDSADTLLYNGLLEELVELIKLNNSEMVDIRSAALRTLTSIVHLDRDPDFPKKSGPRLASIMDITGASQYHGFLPTLVRRCITSLTRQTIVKSEPLTSTTSCDGDKLPSSSSDICTKFPLPLATGLFSFLHHLASYEAGGEALVSCGMMESLLQVINWNGVELEHITFVTRAVRVIDLITNVDMQVFHNHGGLQNFINRLDVEVQLCRSEQTYEFKPIASNDLTISDVDKDFISNYECQSNTENLGKSCLPQRADLLKFMLHFLKKALRDTMFSDNVRHVMEGILPSALRHIIANAEYYGPSLFFLATDLVTVYLFEQPATLTTLQDNGLTDVILHALLIKDVPATGEVLGSLPNVFMALCLNARGLQSFVKWKPFDRLFKVFVSPRYLSAMKPKRSSDAIGDTPSNLGNALNELMCKQSTLKVDAITGIVKLLQELCQLGTDSDSSPVTIQTPIDNEDSSDEEDDEEDDASTSSYNDQNDSQESSANCANEKTPIALVDYVLNIMKLIDAILSNKSKDDHCREFVKRRGLQSLLKILGLYNWPIDDSLTIAAEAVASVCKIILKAAHEPFILRYGLEQLDDVLRRLKPLYSDLDTSSSSRLLHELAHAPHLETAFNNANATPLLHAISAAHGYVLMFVHFCGAKESEITSLSLQHWSSEPGLAVLKNLAELYASIIWESTLLLALCSDAITVECNFAREDMERLNIPVFDRADCNYTSSSDSKVNVASALEGLSTNPTQIYKMDIDGEQITSKPTSQQLKYIKPLLDVSSRLGRALTKLFALLLKLCVGTPVRQRRGQHTVTILPLPTPNARVVATALNYLLANELNLSKLPRNPDPELKLIFLIYSLGFISSMLFDEKRYSYHLMLQKFVSLGGQTTFFNGFTWALSAGNTIELSEGLEHPDLPQGTGEFLYRWLILLEKMVDPKAILDSPNSLTHRSGPISVAARKLLAFSPLGYLIQIHRLAFEAIMFMWGKKPLPTYGLRMSESILSILTHILSGEQIIKARFAKATASNGSRAESDLNQEHVRRLMDMGFSRDHVLEALRHTLNVEQATDYLFSNPTNRAGTSGMDSKFTELINKFIKGALNVCLDLIEAMPETVYEVCELLGTIMKRNGTPFREELLDKLLYIIKLNSIKIYNQYKYRPAIIEVHLELCESRESLCLGYLIHLFALLFVVPSFIDMHIHCGLAVHRSQLLPDFFNLLLLGERMMQHGAVTLKEPKWLTPLLLLLDSLAKVGICTQRKRDMHVVTNRIWRWYDDVGTGKWTPYSTTNIKLINDAYWNGEQSIAVSYEGSRYTISFELMLQCNDDTGNNKLISMTPLCMEHEDLFTDTLEANQCKTFEGILTDKESKCYLPVPVIVGRLSCDIVQTIVRMLHYPIEKDLAHAIMRLCLRLTREYDIAKTFANGGGIRALLKMRQTSSFDGCSSLATILIRHTLEEPQTLAHSLEKLIRGRTLPSIPPSYRDIIYFTRQIGSAVSRAPDTFFEVAKSTFRVDCSIFRRPDDVDSRLQMRTEPTTRTRAPQMKEESSIRVIYDLLHALLKPLEWSVPYHIVEDHCPKPSNTPPATRETLYQGASDLLTNNAPFNEILNMEAQGDSSIAPVMPVHVNVTRGTSEAVNAVIGNIVEQELVTRPMIGKHSILNILADAVVSYGAVAKLITGFSFKIGDADIITEDCSALAFMFDKLLPVTKNISDRDCSMMCRALIAAISSCNHCPEAQSTLVMEVKSALVRALLMPECFEKHNQIQLINGIITTMIENCPPSNQLRGMNGQINNIVQLMLCKGIFNDLARIPHYMDLSSPHFPLTVDSSLKPLELLSRIVNQPITATNSNRMNEHNLDDNGASQSGTTSTEATNAQGEETIEYTENTEHDISTVASSLEANSEVTVAHEADNVLEHLMDQLLERSNNDSNTAYTEVASDSNDHATDIDDNGSLGFDQEPDATEELMSTDSGDFDSNASDQEVEDNDNDDEYENIELTYEDEDDDVNNEVSNADREEDILMIQYADHELALPRIVPWNENGFAIPLLDEQNAPISHPLLVSRHNIEATRTQRTHRAYRYQYLQLNPLDSNSPVVLERLLDPVAQNLSLSENEIMGSPNSRDTAPVVVMGNFVEQIGFVDPSGYLCGPSLAATLNHVPSVLHWWNEESKLLDSESHDITTYVCNKLIPFLITWRNKEFVEHKKKEEGQRMEKKTVEQHETHEIIEARSESTSTNDGEIIENTEQNDPLQSSERDVYPSSMPVLTDPTPQNPVSLRCLDECMEVESELSGGNVETNRTSTDQNLHLSALAGSSNYDGQPFHDNIDTPTNVNGSQNQQRPIIEATATSRDDSIYPFNEGSDKHPLDNLSEVERVASEGISGRHLQDVGNSNYPYRAEPFEEPSDLQYYPFVDMPSFPLTNEVPQQFPRPYPHQYPQQFPPRFSRQFPTSLSQPLHQSWPQRLSRRLPPIPLPQKLLQELSQVLPPALSQELFQFLQPPPLSQAHPQHLPPLLPPLPQTMSHPYQRPLQRLPQRIAQIFPPSLAQTLPPPPPFPSHLSHALPQLSSQPLTHSLPQQFPQSLSHRLSQPLNPPLSQQLNQTFPQRLSDYHVFPPTGRSVSNHSERGESVPRIFTSNSDPNYSSHYRTNQFIPLPSEPVMQPRTHPRMANMLQNVTSGPVICSHGVPVLDPMHHPSSVPLPNCYVSHEPLSPAGHIPCTMHPLLPPCTDGHRRPSIPPAHSAGYQGPMPIPATFSTTHLPIFPPSIQTMPVQQSILQNLSQSPDHSTPENIDSSPSFQSFLELEQSRYTENQNTSDVLQIRSNTGSSDDITEGVDPSFLEASPIRREVVEQYRMPHSLHNRPSSSGTAVEEPAGASASSEVSPEFLAALPPALQEEVLSQQRLEQQQHAAARANPDEPVDAGTFFQTLQPSLRTMILSDMEDSQMSALPPDLAAEAQTLRRDLEARNRQTVQERISNLLPQQAQSGTQDRAELIPPVPSTSQGMHMRGRQLLDHESLSCLLVLIFTNDPKLNTLRLHQVIRNLCYHSPTREWIIKAVLSIIDKSVQSKLEDSSLRPTRRTPKPGPLTSDLITDLKNFGNGAKWLNIRTEAVLGCHDHVFMVSRTSGKRSDRLNGSSITIHPQAGPVVCKNALDLFIFLTKSFPTCLLPLQTREDKEEREERARNMMVLSPSKYKIAGTDFWDMLLKLDSTSSKKGKSLAKTHCNFSLSNDVESICFDFEQSPFGQLLCMLSSSVIYRSTQLIDKLLRLLSAITEGMPELGKTTLNNTTPGNSKALIYESVSAPESVLSLAVNVLTNKSCSADGLRDATTLLLNLAKCSNDTRYVILKLLLKQVLRIGEVVKEQIYCLLHELRKLNQVQKRKGREEASSSSSKGTMQNRFTKETVIITASTKVKAGDDLQLPHMSPLTSKISSQRFFLRVLRIIVELCKGIKEEKEKKKSEEDKGREDSSDSTFQISRLSALSPLETLWETLSLCLLELEHTPDDHAVLILQPAVEAFFLVYSPQKWATDREVNKPQNVVQETETISQSSESGSESECAEESIKSSVTPDQLKLLNFAEKHRTTLNQILRQTPRYLIDGPFSVLVDYTKVLDFDVKRKYFRTELERIDEDLRRQKAPIHVRRSHTFEDSFSKLYPFSPKEWKNRFYIVFEGEEGQDAGGLLREWYLIISRDIFNPMYALFTTSPGDRVTYMVNPASHYNPNHLSYFKFVGRVIAKAIYDNKLLDCYFTRSFYKHILSIPVKYTDMESEDYTFYRGLVCLMECHVNDLGYDLTFSTQINEFGVTETRDLIPDGRNIPVTQENKMEYVRLSCQMKMTGAIRQQLNAFLEGFYDIIPKRLISIFNEQELELLISGLPNVDIDDLKANAEYHKYQSNSLQIQWFWRALRSFDQADRAKFLQFVTGTSKVPLQGFAHLEGMNGAQKFQVHRDDRSTDRLPSAHTCFNQLNLPAYETSVKLRTYLQKAIHECSEGFGFA